MPSRLVARLPAELGGFERGAVLPLSGREGVEAPYATRGLRGAGATVQLLLAPQGAEAMPPNDALLSALIAEAIGGGSHRRIRERGQRFPLPATGSARLLCTEIEGTYGRERVEGLLCAGRQNLSQVRVQVTMPRTMPPAADAREFAAGVAGALAARGPGRASGS